MTKLSVTDKKIDTILVLDFGSQYTQLIARRVRENDVYSEILPWDISEDKIKEVKPVGIILSGGPNSVTKSYTPRAPKIVFDLDIPVLGICYGMQTLAEQMGGSVISADQKEFGHAELELINESKLFHNLNKNINVWMSHGDQVQDLPEDFNLAASSTTVIPFASIGNSTAEYNFGNPAYANSSGVTDGKYGDFENAPPSGHYALCTKRLSEFG